MPHVFGRYVLLDDDGNYNCGICDRRFYSKLAIYAHCRNTGKHDWCESCERVFVTEDSKLAHLRFSFSHNFCNVCDHDFTSYQNLKQHQSLAHSSYRLTLIVSLQHMKVHEEKNIECPACDKDFCRFSYLLLHIERSRCFPINRIEGLINGYEEGHFDCQPDDLSECSFYCQNCDSKFRRLSGLFQHVEDTKDCSYLLRPTGNGDDLESLRQYILETLAYEVEGY
ncbi:hypothetical protein N7448_008340 [Penicillium atrosanguineum]|uniref:Uncharacterized protein n=1 Tax=Penicillium atrosanguineum TaxID=1132637 RepID=A0A9W9KXX9_9EURO|nr:uncharacterized protein N7443_000644 [Penicillium atrosanguineum]KAJ5127561.1 hypothetical protein N7448_008340 [Penicillium atrosanguineum]KAJ5147768.1 hypothetical protein N7526_001120 [Penicillium atrosanguineum]KAJ5313760.1 hypothetical protein N7443_000644 [Penicillium atrosanguineum]KAJ5330933.1 hypothetical protein N7476_000716 [Penicillium atrosanguineum]